MAKRLILILCLLSLDISEASEMTMGQVLKLDLFSLDNLTLSSYLTKITVGTPPKDFNVVIDTGSDLSWLKCSNNLVQSGRNMYNVSDSGTGSIKYCSIGTSCTFNVNYKDGTHTFGYMVSDLFHFNGFHPNSSLQRFTFPIDFGCSTTNTLNPRIDGILGLGRAKESVVSQLYSHQIAPNVISHCLAKKGDGYLLLGEVIEDGFIHTALIPSESKFKVSLDSFSVNGRRIVPAASVHIYGSFFDSGTTLTFLVASFYDPLVDAVSTAVNKSVLQSPGPCYDVPFSNDFPQITLNFADGAPLVLMPEDYLRYFNNKWCLEFQRDEHITILGDLVMRDKVVVYDQPRERMGWLSRDCSQSVNVSMRYNFTSGSVTMTQTSKFRLSSALILFAWFILL